MGVLGRTLIIANPTAKSGRGEAEAELAKNLFTEYAAQDPEFSLDVHFTENEEDARAYAAAAQGYDTIIALGGDGTAHEVANGILLGHDASSTPAFSIIPVGSGNDYARTIEMPFSTEAAVKQIINGKRCLTDVGRCNNEYFLESLSFGIDADIAITSIAMRKLDGAYGMSLYMKAGLDSIRYRYRANTGKWSVNGGATKPFETVICAFTVGATYGGGFKIAPDADPVDGVLNFCYVDNMPARKALPIFLLASKGLHTRFKEVHCEKVQCIHLEFDAEPPCQYDGEPREGSVFDIELCHGLLPAIVPSASRVARMR